MSHARTIRRMRDEEEKEAASPLSPNTRKRRLQSRGFNSPKNASCDYREVAFEIMEHEDEDQFVKKVDTFFQAAKAKPIKHLKSLDHLLEDSFIIGENHDCISSKKFLIQNMDRLKEAGFDTLFMEHLYYDQQQNYDEYFFDETNNPFGPKLKFQLNDLDTGWELSLEDSEEKLKLWSENNFSQLVIAAKKAGIRVVALDTQYEYEHQRLHCDQFMGTQDDYRAKTMNYTASTIIEHEMLAKTTKWCALVGNSHVRTYKNILGLSELTGAKPIYIFDHDGPRSPKIRRTQPNIGEEKLLEGLVIRRYFNVEAPILTSPRKRAVVAGSPPLPKRSFISGCC